MKRIFLITLLTGIILVFNSWIKITNNWIVEKYKEYNYFYTQSDKANNKEYQKFIKEGIRTVKAFFNQSYSNSFDVYVHPNRFSLDTTWQRDWKMPEFKSECWMVASGIATKLDMISPKTWDTTACEHKYAENIKTQQLITHELVHVFHGQLNVSPDFSDVTNIDWFVEGLAVYASGQLDTIIIEKIKKAIGNNKIPQTFDEFWTDNLKYGLSGSVVLYIDKKYGRKKLKELLKYNKKNDILVSLNITEPELLSDWKKYIEQYKYHE